MINEIINPIDFLEMKDLTVKSIKNRKWIWGKTIIKGHKICGIIVNKAIRTIYKNLKIEIRLFDIEDKIISEQKYTLQQWFPPHQNNMLEIDLEDFDFEKFSHFLVDITKADIIKGTRDIEAELNQNKL